MCNWLLTTRRKVRESGQAIARPLDISLTVQCSSTFRHLSGRQRRRRCNEGELQLFVFPSSTPFLLSWAHFPLFIYRQWERQIIITIYKCCCCASLLLVLSLFLSRRNLNSLAVAMAPSEWMKFSTGPQVCESEVRGTSWVISCWCSCARTVERKERKERAVMTGEVVVGGTWLPLPTLHFHLFPHQQNMKQIDRGINIKSAQTVRTQRAEM